MAVSVNLGWGGVLFVGVLTVRALALGTLSFGHSRVATKGNRAPEARINIRISRSGSKAQKEGDTRNHVLQDAYL